MPWRLLSCGRRRLWGALFGWIVPTIVGNLVGDLDALEEEVIALFDSYPDF